MKVQIMAVKNDRIIFCGLLYSNFEEVKTDVAIRHRLCRAGGFAEDYVQAVLYRNSDAAFRLLQETMDFIRYGVLLDPILQDYLLLCEKNIGQNISSNVSQTQRNVQLLEAFYLTTGRGAKRKSNKVFEVFSPVYKKITENKCDLTSTLWPLSALDATQENQVLMMAEVIGYIQNELEEDEHWITEEQLTSIKEDPKKFMDGLKSHEKWNAQFEQDVKEVISRFLTFEGT